MLRKLKRNLDQDVPQRGGSFNFDYQGLVRVEETVAKILAGKIYFIVKVTVVETNNPEKYPLDSAGTWYTRVRGKDFHWIRQWVFALGISTVTKEMMVEATMNPNQNQLVGKIARLDTRNGTYVWGRL